MILTPVQQQTADALMKGNFEDIKLANLTRFLTKILADKETAKKYIPHVVDFETQTMGKDDKFEVLADLRKRVKSKDARKTLVDLMKSDFEITDEADGGEVSSETSRRPKFDKGKKLDDILDMLNEDDTKPSQVGGDKGRPPKDYRPKPSEGKRPSQIGGDKGRPPSKDYNPVAPTRGGRPSQIGGDKGRPPSKDYNPVAPTRGGRPSQIGGDKGRPPSKDYNPVAPTGRPSQVGGDKGLPPKKPSKLKAMAVRGDRGQYAESQTDQLLGGKDKDVWTGGGGGGKTEPPMPSSGGYTPYSGEAFNLTKEDIASNKPATMKEFMKRNGKSGPPKQNDYEAYAKYMDNAKEGIAGLDNEWDRVQEDIAKNRKKAQQSGKIGRPLDDSNDPFGILRALGYKFDSDFGEGTVGMLAGSVFRSAGHMAEMIPGIGEPVGKGLELIGDIVERVGNWLEHVRNRRDHYWGKTTREEIATYDPAVLAEQGDAIGINSGTRGDEYYQPGWSYNDYLPTRVDEYGELQFNSELQAQYLKPFERYVALLNNRVPAFVDSITPEQRKFLEQLRSTVVKIKQGELNITHAQYKGLLEVMITGWTPEQREKYLHDVEQDVIADVTNVYTKGKGQHAGTIYGGEIPFGEYIIEAVTKTAEGEPPSDPDPSETEEDQEDPEKEKEKEKEKEGEEEKDDDKEPDKPEDEPEPEPEPEEPKPDIPKGGIVSEKFGAGEGTYRTRGVWGNTDELFEVNGDKKEIRNLITESMCLNTGINRTSDFYKAQQIENALRYSNCFRMPSAPPPEPTNIPNRWKTEYGSVWNSQLDTTTQHPQYNPYDYGERVRFMPKYNESTARGVEMSNSNYYPEIQYQLNRLNPMDKINIQEFNFIENSRFIN